VAKVGTSKSGGKQWQTTPKNLAQDAAYQSHTSRLNELWSLPKPAQGLNTYNNIIVLLDNTSYTAQSRGGDCCCYDTLILLGSNYYANSTLCYIHIYIIVLLID